MNLIELLKDFQSISKESPGYSLSKLESRNSNRVEESGEDAHNQIIKPAADN